MADVSENFMQVGSRGICFAHGPYIGQSCPRYIQWKFERGMKPNIDCPCTTDPQKPEYVAIAKERARQANKVYTQAEMDAAIATALVGQRLETWAAAEDVAAERVQEYAVRAQTELAAKNQDNADAWANWTKGAARVRQAIHAAAIQSGKGER